MISKVHKFMGAEGVWLNGASPIGVDSYFALFRRADTIAPVIFIGKAATGPANHRYIDRFQCGHYITSDTTHIGYFGVFADPYAAIDTLAEMLGELPEYIAINDRAWLFSMYG